MIEKLKQKDYKEIENLGKYIKESFSADSIADRDIIYVFKENNNIVAFIQIEVLYETMDIINIAVEKKYRRKKIGETLLNYVIDSHKPQKIMLEVRESNEAVKFYEKNNFIEIRRIKNYYDNEDAIVMERSLV